MRITFDIDTESPTWKNDREEITRIFKAWMKFLSQPEEPKQPKVNRKEEAAALNTVTEILKEPVKKPEKKPAKKWNEKQKQDIQAIKDAVKAKKKPGKKKKPLDDPYIAQLRDDEKMTFKEISNIFGCCEQTIINHYNKAKEKP